MKIRTLLFIAVLLCAAPLSARPGNDPNAAVRYLNAIGHIPAVSEKVMHEIALAESEGQMKDLGTDTLRFLGEPRLKTAMELLRRGAACPQCNFTPDDRIHFTDFVPPYRRIREMARIGRAYAFLRNTAGDPGEAFETLTSIFMLGQHVDDNSMLINTMIGIAVRKIALNALAEFRTHHPEESWKTRLTEFFKRVPRPAANIRAALEYERTGIMNTFQDAKIHPEIFKEIGFEFDITASAPVEAQPDSGKRCLANQRVLMGALEMLHLDYSKPLPATISSDLLPSLVKLQYLKAPVSCPDGGKYTLTGLETEAPGSACSLHGTPDAPLETAGSSGEAKKTATAEYLKKLTSTPEYDRLVDECKTLYDELIALDPAAADFEQKADDIQKRVESSTNILIKNGIPNVKKSYAAARELEEQIEKILR